MAEKWNNKHKDLVIKMTPQEALNICHFGFGFDIVCDMCNCETTGDEFVYYVASINQLFCSDCVRLYVKREKYIYEKYTDNELYNYNYYARLLGLETID